MQCPEKHPLALHDFTCSLQQDRPHQDISVKATIDAVLVQLFMPVSGVKSFALSL